MCSVVVVSSLVDSTASESGSRPFIFLNRLSDSEFYVAEENLNLDFEAVQSNR